MIKALSIKWGLHYCLTCLILIAVLASSGCQRDVSDADKKHTVELLASYNTNQFLLNKLRDNRVLFLGDYGHRRYLYKKTVADFLAHWVDQVEAGTDSVPRKLFLILEMDSIEAGRLKSSLENCDIGTRLAESPPGFLGCTTGHLQFYWYDLANVFSRVVSYNSGDHDDSIYFDIIGPERPIDLENWSFIKRDSFFVYERDQYSSAKVIELLEGHPEYKAVVFYGGTHLHRTEQLKHTETVEDSAYFLAHYVAERFEGDGGVYTVYQSSVSENFMRDNVFMKAPGKTYAIDNEFLDKGWFVSQPENVNWVEVCDGSVAHFEPAIVDPSMGLIRSQRIVGCVLQQIEKYENSQHDFFGRYWLSADRYLRIVSGLDPIRMNTFTYEDWVNWRQSTTLDMVDMVTSLDLWERLIDLMEIAEGESAHKYDTLIAKCMRMVVDPDTSKTPADRVRAYREYLNAFGDEIIIENLVNLLFVGTDEEIDKALPILRKLTDQNLETAPDWANWLRQSGIADHPI